LPSIDANTRAGPAGVTIDLTIVGEIQPLHAELLDLSVGGLRAELHEELPVGLKASVKLGDRLGLRLPTRVLAEVVANSDNEVRLQFLAASDETIARLHSLLRDAAAPPLAGAQLECGEA